MPGAFITLEGIEGVGKSTALDYIRKFFQATGIEVVTTREPGGTPWGEMVRKWLLEGTHDKLSGELEALLMFAARSHHLESIIKPALAAGHFVVCDRFSDATFAYQGAGRGADLNFLQMLKQAVQGSFEPDLTFLLDAPVDVGMKRISDRPADHFEREAAPFFERIRSHYLRLAEENGGRIVTIDANRPRKAIQRDLERYLRRFLKSYSAADV